MGVGYKLPLTYNVIKTTLKSTNHEAGKKQFKLSLDTIFMLRQFPNERNQAKNYLSMTVQVLFLCACLRKSRGCATVKSNKRRITYSQIREQMLVPDLHVLTLEFHSNFSPFFYATFQCGRYDIIKFFFALENIKKNALKSCS